MTRLTLLRHAKSTWGTGEADFDRPLNERGRRDAPLMGRVCSEKLPLPDLVLVSSARRTCETMELAAKAWGLEGVEITETDSLYLAGLTDWVSIMEAAKDRADHILACAHQPGVELFARWLDHSFQGDVPTCTVISLSFEGEFGSGMGQVDFYGTPKDFR
jgi:phosphohistidine phosphatase